MGRYAQLIYHPLLGESFRCVYHAQIEEFERLYGQPPTHVDGHQHMHLCSNMRAGRVIPAGLKVRRGFSFWPGEKSSLNRLYRRRVDLGLSKRYRVVDFFFSLRQCLAGNRLERVACLAREAKVELMTHPEIDAERNFLLGDTFYQMFDGLQMASYVEL
jgi:chitin disaccharide deacetylase